MPPLSLTLCCDESTSSPSPPSAHALWDPRRGLFLWVTFLLVEFLINLHSVLRMGSVPFLRFFCFFVMNFLL